MAINPQLLAVLMQTAPYLLSALGSGNSRNMNPGTYGNINSALNKGYDPNLIAKDVVSDYINIVEDMNLDNYIDGLPTSGRLDLPANSDDAMFAFNKALGNMNTNLGNTMLGVGSPFPADYMNPIYGGDAINSANVFKNPNNMKDLAQRLLRTNVVKSIK